MACGFLFMKFIFFAGTVFQSHSEDGNGHFAESSDFEDRLFLKRSYAEEQLRVKREIYRDAEACRERDLG